MTYLAETWPWWLGIALAAAYFIVFERRGFLGKNVTLSRFVFDLQKSSAFVGILIGAFIAGLLVHFFWHWCPDGGLGVGLLMIPRGGS